MLAWNPENSQLETGQKIDTKLMQNKQKFTII